MKILDKSAHILLSIFLLFISLAASAHTAVTVTVPKNGSVLSEAPQEIILRFSDEAYLNSISIIDDLGEIVPIQNSDSEVLSRRFNILLPAMGNGSYTVLWSAEGTDTHPIQGELSFTIDGSSEK